MKTNNWWVNGQPGPHHYGDGQWDFEDAPTRGPVDILREMEKRIASELNNEMYQYTFSPEQIFVVTDYETRSVANLKKTGSYSYSRHPSTRIMCVAWAKGTMAQLTKIFKEITEASDETPDGAELSPREELKAKYIKTWCPDERATHRKDRFIENGNEFLRDITDPNNIVVAHNAPFEQCITRNVLHKHFPFLAKKNQRVKLPSERWLCTASMAAAASMPQKLEHLCEALELPHEKDMAGNRVMLQLSKPRKPSKKNPDVWVNDPAKFDHMVRYCVGDIIAEIGCLVYLPMLSADERRLWILDQKMNLDGVKVDRPLVKKMGKLIDLESVRLTKELRTITNGQVSSVKSIPQMLAWLHDNECYVTDLTKKSVEDALKDGVAPVVRRVLEIRQQLGKSSIAKYPAFLDVSENSGFARFMLRFHGANTGRWAGMNLQPQNFPRGNVKETLIYPDGHKVDRDLSEEISDFISAWPHNSERLLKALRHLYCKPYNRTDHDGVVHKKDAFTMMDIFSSCLRNMFVARDGMEFFVSDFAAIEARVLFWLAEHDEGCQAFFENRKMYEEMAMVIFNVKRIEDVTKDQRFVGKQTLLGCGYSMGWKKFIASCLLFGQVIPVDVAKKAVKSYRSVHSPVVDLWDKYEKACILAIKNPHKIFKTNRCSFFMQNFKGRRWLCVKLPSGRLLRYYNPSVDWGETPWGEKKPQMRYWCVNPKTRKWFKDKTYGGALTENIDQGVSRDLMAAALWRWLDAGYMPRLTVHDEGICERAEGEGSLQEYETLMKETPAWANGCPVNVEGWQGHRYRK